MCQALLVLLLSLVSTAISAQCAAKAPQSLAPQMKSSVKRAPIQLSEEDDEEPPVAPPMKSAVKGAPMQSSEEEEPPIAPQMISAVKKAPMQLSEKEELIGLDGTTEQTEKMSPGQSLLDKETAPVVTEWEKLISDFCLLLVGFATCKVFLLLRRSAPNHRPTESRPTQSMRAQEAPSRRALQSGGIEGKGVMLPLGTNKTASDAEGTETPLTAAGTGCNTVCESVYSLDQETATDALGFPGASPNMFKDLTPNAGPLHSTPNANCSEVCPTVKFPSLLNSRMPLGKKAHALPEEALLSV